MKSHWKRNASLALVLAALTACHHAQNPSPATNLADAPTTEVSATTEPESNAETTTNGQTTPSTEMSPSAELAPTTQAVPTTDQAVIPVPTTEASKMTPVAAPSVVASTEPSTSPTDFNTVMSGVAPTPIPTTNESTNAAPATAPTEQSAAATPTTAATTAPALNLVSSIPFAIATIEPKSGSHVSGTVTFTQTPDGVAVVADIDGLTPGQHGFHIHQYADLSDEKGEGAGSHYDPRHTHHHGLPGDPMPHHPGDMGNLSADANGHAHLEILLPGITIEGDKDPILGRSVVIHAKPDDGSEPSGNAGARVGVGVIGVGKAPL